MSTQNDLIKIREKISEIEEKSASGDYIYRGEPKCHKKVSSTFYRQYEDDIEAKHFDIEVAQEQMLEGAKDYIHEKDKIEILTQLQHYGGKTNLIDFTTDYLIALFFACDGSPDEDGRVILLQKTEEIEKEYQIEEPRNPINRVIAQKSIFVRPPKGFIEPEQYKVTNIPKCLKEPMLNHLQKYHGISPETIYNDLHGFIKNQDIHQTAYIEFYMGLTNQQKGDSENEDTNETRVL